MLTFTLVLREGRKLFFRHCLLHLPLPFMHLSHFFCHFSCSLSYSKNGVIRIDGFSSPDQHDEEALSLWAPDAYEENDMELETSKYILSYIGDKFCQLVMSEKTAVTWIKKDGIFTYQIVSFLYYDISYLLNISRLIWFIIINDRKCGLDKLQEHSCYNITHIVAFVCCLRNIKLSHLSDCCF